MTESEWIEKLKKEGFTDLDVIVIEPHEDPEHNHEYHTVNVILKGNLTIIDQNGSNTYQAGDRVDTPAGTTHRATAGPDPGLMIQGFKK